jgi:hypothetical protein
MTNSPPSPVRDHHQRAQARAKHGTKS